MTSKGPVTKTSSAPTATALPEGPIVFVIGPPGSGKSTLCSRLCERLPGKLKHLSVGDYLRELCSSNEPKALPSQSSDPESGRLSRDEIAKHVQESRLLPPDTIIPLIKAKLLDSESSPGIGWLIDGFPRDMETARAFDQEIKFPRALIRLDCDPDIARQRFLKRQRATSDDEVLFEKRLKEYDEKWGDIVSNYSEISFKVHSTSSEDDSMRQVLDFLQGQYDDIMDFQRFLDGIGNS